MRTGSTLRLQVKHKKLWADKVVELQYRLIVMNGITSFQETDPETVFKFHCIVIVLLLRDWELDMPSRGTFNLAAFVPGGTPYKADDS